MEIIQVREENTINIILFHMKAHSGIHTCCLDDIMCSEMCINVEMIKEMTILCECNSFKLSKIIGKIRRKHAFGH